jgi:hypothetical protein
MKICRIACCTADCRRIPGHFRSDAEIQDWLDSYWSKDVQTLFRLERRASFQKFFELLLAQSGAFSSGGLAAPCEVSRPTIANSWPCWRPPTCAGAEALFHPSAFGNRGRTKVYGFDTGFVCAMRVGIACVPKTWGFLEHLVLNEMLARLGRPGWILARQTRA